MIYGEIIYLVGHIDLSITVYMCVGVMTLISAFVKYKLVQIISQLDWVLRSNGIISFRPSVWHFSQKKGVNSWCGIKRENMCGEHFILSTSLEQKKPRGSNELLTGFNFQLFCTFSNTYIQITLNYYTVARRYARFSLLQRDIKSVPSESVLFCHFVFKYSWTHRRGQVRNVIAT